jgi:tRNA (guanine37-N1)-methyltransferase
MNISILSVFPRLYNPFLETSLIRRAQEQKIVQFDLTDFFSFVAPKERIDAPTFGHNAGMLLKPEVVQKAIEAKEAAHGPAYKIFFSPHGKKLDQKLLQEIADESIKKKHLMLIPARYEGMDARVEETYADQVISIGDFVLMGGDLPAMILLEGCLRLIPGVVGKRESVQEDSFSGPFVDYPEYTMPVVWKGKEVPDIVRSGNHAEIALWRKKEAVKRTLITHFDWLRSSPLVRAQKQLTLAQMPPHYIALLHNDIVVGEGDLVGNTSVTSLDIHDIARSARTYGIKNYFIVTELIDQQKIVRKLLDFWQTGSGVEYNASRHEAVKRVELLDSLQSAIAAIEAQEGVKPLVVATSARVTPHERSITYHDQGALWQKGRPILMIFGTGRGLAQEVLEKCDYLLVPVEGLMEYNHLSVRTAVGIVLDRWLGLNPKT